MLFVNKLLLHRTDKRMQYLTILTLCIKRIYNLDIRCRLYIKRAFLLKKSPELEG